MRPGLNTRCVHAGGQRDGEAVITPIQPATAYRYGNDLPVLYPRYFNTANQQVVVDKLAQLEHAESGLLFSSGMASITTAFVGLVPSGSHVVISDQIYGGTHELATLRFEQFGLTCTRVDVCDVDAVERAIRVDTAALFLESPSNPLVRIADLRAIADLARPRRILTMIDNTFASPINQNPIDLGFDLVLHSGTKYLGGHSDLTFGVALGRQELIDKMLPAARSLGGATNALDCYLIERSLKTLGLRVERQNANALRIAGYLAERPEVARVYYSGLPNDPGHALAVSQMRGFGGMLAFELAAGTAQAVDLFTSSLRLIIPALSLGGVDTTVCVPATSSHKIFGSDERRRLGISDSLIRLSAGIEDAADLIADLEQAFDKLSGTLQSHRSTHILEPNVK